MSKVSDNSIRDVLHEDWGNDDRTGKPYSGEAVRTALQEKLREHEEANEATNTRVDEANAEIASTKQAMGEAYVGVAVSNEVGVGAYLTFAKQNGSEQVVGPIVANAAVEGRITLKAQVSALAVKVNEDAVLTYTAEYFDSEGDAVPLQAITVGITMRMGSIVKYADTVHMASGTREIHMGKMLSEAGKLTIELVASTTDDQGNAINKRALIQVEAIDYNLTSAYNMARTIQGGGYADGEDIDLPYDLKGSGSSVVLLYLDGDTYPLREDSAQSTGQLGGSFKIPASTLTAGRHTVQLVAHRLDGDGNVQLSSQCIHIDLLKAPSLGDEAVAFVGMKYSDPTGDVRTGDAHLTPTMRVVQYDTLDFDWVAYTPDSLTVPVNERVAGEQRTLQADRTTQHYSRRFTEAGNMPLAMSIDAADTNVETQYNASIAATIIVAASDVTLREATQSLAFKLSPNGRSNDEPQGQREVWADGDTTVAFEGVDWDASGWTGQSLRLRNGATAVVGFTPFTNNTRREGLTVELEVKMVGAGNKYTPVVSCIDNGVGFAITTDEASLYTGSTKDVTTEYGDTKEIPVGMAMKLGAAQWYKIAFVLHKADVNAKDSRLMELYINGVRSSADVYGTSDTLTQTTQQLITISSEAADVEVRNIRAYNRALRDDELTDNYIVDQADTTQMVQLFKANDVLGETGTVSLDKLLERGKAAILVIREGGLQPVNADNDKSKNFACDKVIIYTPWGDTYYIHNPIMRIQGTSSTKYPRKNYRFYAAKSADTKVYLNGEDADCEVTSRLIAMYEGDTHPVKVLCAKADYSDSSMTHNTGLAMVWNDTTRTLGIQTPAQQADPTRRVSIYGYPVDIFAAETMSGERTYWGQYNLNNDKSNWEDVLGLKNVGNGIDDANVISLEFLNNSERLGKFQCDQDLDTQLNDEFGNALEFNWPKDTYWTEAEATAEEGKVATPAHKQAIKKLWAWVRDCVPAGADTTEYKNLASFESAKFKAEVGDHFNTQQLLTWYLFTDYFAMVDQRVKNMVWQTWDGQQWWLNYYDGDTSLLLDNTSFLRYLYTVSRDTYDAEAKKYAFEGHDSVLWCLVLANLREELATQASTMRASLGVANGSVINAAQVLNVRQMGNWSARQYNKSGELKYITPLTEGVDVKGTTVKYDYIYALQGSREAHRTHTLENRFALLDSKYGTGQYRADNVGIYLARTAAEAESTIVVTSADNYCFGWGTPNVPNQQPSVEVFEDGVATMRFNTAFTQNDPISLYGASRMKRLDLKGVNGQLVKGVSLNNCTQLIEIDAHTDHTTTNDWFLDLAACTRLKRIDLYGQISARTSSSGNEINLASQTRLEYLDCGHTKAKSVVVAKGAPVEYLRLPETITSLRLESLQRLVYGDASASLVETTNNAPCGLVTEGLANVTTLVVTACPNINALALLEQCASVQRVRLTDIDITSDGEILRTLMQRGVQGIDKDGNVTERPQITGRVALTKYAEDLAEMQAYFDGLEIKQTEYTMITIDVDCEIDARVYNNDNGTGFPNLGAEYYKPSGHILKYLNSRHRVMAKCTSLSFDAAKTSFCYFPMHDDGSQKFADKEKESECTNVNFKGVDGEWMIVEPHHWRKGVNDYLGRKNYFCISTNEECPAAREDTKKVYIEGITTEYEKEIVPVGNTLNIQAKTACGIAELDVRGYKRARWTSAPELGAKFVDASGNIVQVRGEWSIVPSGADFNPGMYVIADVPEGAVKLVFSYVLEFKHTYCVLSNSDKIEDMEPDWDERVEELITVAEMTDTGKCVTGGTYEYQKEQASSVAMKAGKKPMAIDTWATIILAYVMKTGYFSNNHKYNVVGNENESNRWFQYANKTSIGLYDETFKDGSYTSFLDKKGVKSTNVSENTCGYLLEMVTPRKKFIYGTFIYQGYSYNGSVIGKFTKENGEEVKTFPYSTDDRYSQKPFKYVMWGRECLPIFCGTETGANDELYYKANKLWMKYVFTSGIVNIFRSHSALSGLFSQQRQDSYTEGSRTLGVFRPSTPDKLYRCKTLEEYKNTVSKI